MKTFLTLTAVLSLGSVAAQAGCGKIETTAGKLKAFNAESKTLTVEAGGKDVQITLTPETKGADQVAGLVGKNVTVDASHKKATSVAAK